MQRPAMKPEPPVTRTSSPLMCLPFGCHHGHPERECYLPDMIADVAIRIAMRADAAEIAAMSRECIEAGLPWRWRRERVARAIADAETNVVVAGEPGAILAFGIMSYLEEDAHLLLFAVRQSSRRQGVGSAVLLWLEAVARAAG